MIPDPRHTGPRGSQWTPERDQILTARWAAGEVSSAIALAMGVTRNAVMGRVQRLKLPSRPSPIKPARKDIPPARKRVASQASPRLRPPAETRRKPGGVSSLNSAPAVASNGAAGVLFGELRPEHCRWPLWGMERPAEFAFCGCPKAEGRPYCAGHAARAFLPPKPIGPSAVKPDWNAAIGGGKAFEK